jgi:hypothetical protein
MSEWPTDYQEQFWAAYPRHKAKITAMKALDKIYKEEAVEWHILIEAVKHYADETRGRDAKWIRYPATWLRAGCWDDEPDTRPQTFADIAMGK